MSKEKREALRLLKKYDKLRAELRTVENDLKAACNAYGRTKGQPFMRIDTLRVEMDIEREKQIA
jgi:hypothetical protein